LGHPCNARFCWCFKHWEENQKIVKNSIPKIDNIELSPDELEEIEEMGLTEYLEDY
jgi:hypothetical protein